MKKLFIMMMLFVFVLCGCTQGSGDDSFQVGVIQLVRHDALDAATNGFVDVLNAEFGDKISIDIQYASGDSATCSTIASSFVSDGYDLILGNATASLQAAAHATNQIPVLGTAITEYGVALDLDDFNGTVGGNISGTSDLAPLEGQADMLLELLPEASRVGILFCSGEPNSLYQVKVVKSYLQNKGIEVREFAFADSNDVALVTAQACDEVDVIYIPTDNTAASNGEIIASTTSQANIPVIAGEEGVLTNCGGLATLSIDYYELGKTTGQMAIKILKGEADISQMPIEYFEEPVKKISLKMAEKYGIEVPEGYVTVE